jgi:hypothetical protein
MHILIGLALAVALLYFWLVGHWFARALVFLLFALAFGFALGGAMSGGNFGGPAIPGWPQFSECLAATRPVNATMRHDSRSSFGTSMA